MSDGVPATIEILAGNEQTANAGSSVATAPAVRVRNAGGSPVPGIAVEFVVSAGGGSVLAGRVVTDARGLANAGSWMLGPIPGTNVLLASIDGQLSARFTATAESPFNIAVRWVGTATARQEQAVDSAVSRWRSVILSELEDVPLAAPAGSCFHAQPASNETVDDLLLYVEFASIDGAGKVLGQAGPCYIRGENSLPILGYLMLDTADLTRMEALGLLDDLVLHEIGHILGIGTLWTDLGLLTGAGGADPVFTGAHALAAYRQSGGPGGAVPVENTGSTGTRDGHWRESVFGNELMTAYLGGLPNPLSIITIGSLQDLGYSANAAAAQAWPVASAVQSQAAAETIDGISSGEVLITPKYRIDRRGSASSIGW
jgi:hypothetical protein